MPITAAELAEDAARALAAGARELHVHPRGPDGNDTVEPAARVGLEDTIVLPDGTSARDNAELVAEAARRVELLS